ncbi:NADP-dependent oxidoreductase [Kribbella solani]|uniref:NADP-dependent oxidoreductase n=1 Tax=Kribbella solani TaxID=236067 RepID=UPI0029B117EE|nr:NADP-dependent oxidoreductase [Kribbella solani]MDX2971170.1 NADP-dependent oxidoreductase [Kribbella solani]
MRAVLLDSTPSTPAIGEVERPRPVAGELLVKVAASSVNGFDAATAAGYLQGMMEHRFPLVVGMDFAGTVEAVFGVARKPFLGAGSMAEYVTVPAGAGVAAIPAGLPVAHAGALGLAGSAALDAVTAVNPAAGETLLISGATGGVGALAVQLAAGRGVRVIATARPGAETGFVLGLTGTKVYPVDYTADLESQVRAVAPDGVDAVLHLAGDPEQLAGLLRPGGRLASTLIPGADAIARADIDVHAVMADTSTQTLSDLATRAAAGDLRVPITSTYPLHEATKAFAAFTTGALGKLSTTCP